MVGETNGSGKIFFFWPEDFFFGAKVPRFAVPRSGGVPFRGGKGAGGVTRFVLKKF